MLEAFRYLVTCGLNQGGTPAVMTAMAKYYATETMRKVVNHGMDIAGGRAIQLDHAISCSHLSSNSNCYYGRRRKYFNPLVDDFGQGSMRCHPYLLKNCNYFSLTTKPMPYKNSMICCLNI